MNQGARGTSACCQSQRQAGQTGRLSKPRTLARPDGGRGPRVNRKQGRHPASRRLSPNHPLIRGQARGTTTRAMTRRPCCRCGCGARTSPASAPRRGGPPLQGYDGRGRPSQGKLAGGIEPPAMCTQAAVRRRPSRCSAAAPSASSPSAGGTGTGAGADPAVNRRLSIASPWSLPTSLRSAQRSHRVSF